MPEEEVGAEVEAETEDDLGESVDDETLDALSEEDVESLLDEQLNPKEEGEEEEKVEPAEPEPEPEKEGEPEAKKPAEEPEKKSEPTEPVEKKVETVEDRVARLEGENADLLDKFERQKTQLGRWSNEIGEMRRLQKTLDETEMTDAEFAAKMEENPREAIRMEQAQVRAKADNAELEQQRLRDRCEESVRGQVSDLDELMPEMVELARSKYGLADWGVDTFKKDPFRFNEREILDLARDAKLQRLEAKLTTAESKNADLKKGGGNLTEKINKVAKKPPRVAAGSGQGTEGRSSADLTDGDLSDAQIEGMDEKTVSKILKERGVPI